MNIVGREFHLGFQQIAVLDNEAGVTEEHMRMYRSGGIESLYRKLASPAIVGIDWAGSDQWFVQLLQKRGQEVCVGDSAQIGASQELRGVACCMARATISPDQLSSF